MLYSLSHWWYEARLNPADPVLEPRRCPPGHGGRSVAGRQQVRVEGVSDSLLCPTCHCSLCGPLAPVCYEELFQLTVGPCFGYCWPNPGTAKGSGRCCAGLSWAPLHPGPHAQVLHCHGDGTGVMAALGTAELGQSNANRADTALPVPHTQSSPASFCWWADLFF